MALATIQNFVQHILTFRLKKNSVCFDDAVLVAMD